MKTYVRLRKGQTQKGLRVALRDRCSPKLIPDKNYDYNFVEGKDLTCDHEKRFITLETANKRARPNTEERKRLDRLREEKKKKTSKKATFMDMVRAYKEDPEGYSEYIVDNDYTEDEIHEFNTTYLPFMDVKD